jgi:hypothetical protein
MNTDNHECIGETGLLELFGIGPIRILRLPVATRPHSCRFVSIGGWFLIAIRLNSALASLPIRVA